MPQERGYRRLGAAVIVSAVRDLEKPTRAGGESVRAGESARAFLTAHIEDLLGFTLPDSAHVDHAWWANNGPHDTPPPQSRSWTLASRTATPNLQAQTVLFERAHP